MLKYTANIYSFLLCPVSTVVSLYGLHLIPYPVQGRSYSKKTVISFTIIPLYLEQQLNVNHTVRLQWKVGHIEHICSVDELKNKIVKPHYQSFVLSNFDIDKLLGIITIVLYWFD